MNRISQAKEKILELLWESTNPIGPKEVAAKFGIKGQSANMHLLRLAKLGYVSKSETGHYSITGLGKEAIGFPQIDGKFADKVLSKASADKAFHFFGGIGQPLGTSSTSLVDFCERIKTIDMKSVDFHMSRGDFETWISSLGDIELAKRLKLIREAKLTGEALRKRLYETLRTRCDELLKSK